MADGNHVASPRDYAAIGARLGLAPLDVEGTLFLAARGYYRGTRGPRSEDPLVTALRKHAAIECPHGAAAIDEELAAEAATPLNNVIAYTPRRTQGTRPRVERRAEQHRRDALEAGQLWFSGWAWRLDAANDDAEVA